MTRVVAELAAFEVSCTAACRCVTFGGSGDFIRQFCDVGLSSSVASPNLLCPAYKISSAHRVVEVSIPNRRPLAFRRPFWEAQS